MTMQVGIARQLLNWLLRTDKQESTNPATEGLTLLGCKLFLALNTLLWAVIGGGVCLAVWAVLGQPIQWGWLVCAAGYPAILIGLWGGVLYLYLHTEF
ncbi:MAG: hypothetical protein LUD84_02415 [Clostridiales bacterium]|nr:hypothetical protein [Clostridiales bacterium]